MHIVFAMLAEILSSAENWLSLCVFVCFDSFFIVLIVCVHTHCTWCVFGVCMLFMVDIDLIDRVRDRDCLCDEFVLLLSLCVSVCLL